MHVIVSPFSEKVGTFIVPLAAVTSSLVLFSCRPSFVYVKNRHRLIKHNGIFKNSGKKFEIVGSGATDNPSAFRIERSRF